MSLAACLYLGGWFSNYSPAKNVGGVMFIAYGAMRLKKAIYPGLEGHAPAMLIWTLAGAYLIYLGLKNRENYGISLIQPAAGVLLILSGTCYLWARAIGVLSVNGQPHAATADYLALLAMVLVGCGLVGSVTQDSIRSWNLDNSDISRD